MFAPLPNETRQRNTEIINRQNKLEEGSAESILNLLDMPIFNIVVQEGPYCPLNCKNYCYGDFGTHHKGFAPVELYEKIMEQIADTAIEHIIITDGEPFHNIGRLEEVVQTIKGIPMELNTSGFFATSQEKAREVLERIKLAGYTPAIQEVRSRIGFANSTINLSADEYHPNSFAHTVNTVLAHLEVFPNDCDAKELARKWGTGIVMHNIAITHTTNNKKKRAIKKIEREKIISPIKQQTEIKTYHFKAIGGTHIFKKKLAVLIHSSTVIGEGRATNIVTKKEPREIKPEEMGRPTSAPPALYIKSNGDIYFVPSYHCITPGRFQGNIYQQSLAEIITTLQSSPLYKMEVTRGVRGIYHHLYNKGIKLEGTDHCDICKNIFYNKESVDLMNQKFAEPWRKYEDKLRLEAEKTPQKNKV